jgi:hypothetical protein
VSSLRCPAAMVSQLGENAAITTKRQVSNTANERDEAALCFRSIDTRHWVVPSVLRKPDSVDSPTPGALHFPYISYRLLATKKLILLVRYSQKRIAK